LKSLYRKEITMRLFIGIKTGCEDHLKTLQQALLRIGRGRLTAEANLHLTLRFLGEAQPKQVESIRRAMNSLNASPFSLECRGAFLLNKNGIAAADVGGDAAALRALHTQLETALEACGFPKELRRFRPHITLARQYRVSSGADVAAIPFCPCAFTVREIILFESKRVDGRLVYEPLFVKRLGK
jgi:2'-5' RNA ligase